MLRKALFAFFSASAFFFLPTCVLLAHSAVPSNTWAAANPLGMARSGATATLMADGRILIAGGYDSSGNPTSSVEIYNTDGSVSRGPSMSAARADHAALALSNNDVLVTGGITTAGGNAINSAEIYDPVQNLWTPAGGMGQARTGHTLSQLLDGTVLVAGGASAGVPVSLLEVFDGSSNAFVPRGYLATPRTQHASAVLPDGRVMIIGGVTRASDGSAQTLASTEIFDPSSGSVSTGPSLITGRSGHTATTTLSGDVIVIGGTNPASTGTNSPAELSTAEIFDPSATTPAFTQSASKLATARTGHLAVLLPHNASVLVIGGTAAGSPLPSVELYTPWLDTFQSVGSMTDARLSAAATALMNPSGVGTDGRVLVAGGQNSDGTLSSTEMYGFATVKTDKGDYAPGTIVTITGSGWQPGETVTLSFREYPNIDTPGPFSVVADASGNISDTEFSPDSNDVNVRFYLTAVGESSIYRAQTIFTDSVTTTTTLTCTTYSVQIGQPTTCTATTATANASFEGWLSFSISPSNAGTFSNFNPLANPQTTPPSCGTNGTPTKSFACTVTYTPSSLESLQTLTACYSSTNPGKDQSCGSSASVNISVTPDLTLTINPTTVPYGSTGPVMFTAVLTNGTSGISGDTVTFTVDGFFAGSAVTDGSGTATLSNYNPSALSVGPHTVLASSAAGTFGGITYNSAISNQQTLTVTQIGTTTTINAPAITYGQDGSVTVTVSSGSGTPTGNVSLTFNGGAAVSKVLSGGSATFTCTDISGLCTPPANTSGYPLSASYVAQNGFGASSNTGTLVVNPFVVTLTGGSYSGVYDGSTHVLTACTSSAPTYVTCTNNPAGPVGPDVNVGGPTPVTPTPVYAQGNAADYTITPTNGSWSITPLAVTLTGGSYSGVYDGNTHGLSTCASSASTFVTCTNNPAGPVGPDIGGPTAVTPTPVYAKGNAGDYTITPTNGSWSITPLAVTLTGGSYSGVYDGNTHALSACASSASTFVTCTNSPAGPVGPDVNVGGPTSVTPTPVYGSAIAGDFTITSNNGSWSITPLTVTVTGGSYSGVYDGNTHALPACTSTYAGVTCSNNPAGPVGPNVGGPTAVVPVPVVGSGIAADYTINAVNGSWSITPLGVTLTAGSLNAVYNGSTQSPSACGSSAPGFVTCTNNPNSVGPNVVTAATVTPTPVYAAGSVAGDYSITSVNGNATITPLTVTVTGGSYSGVYDGSTHALPACASTYAGITCSNTPAGPVGPNVGGPTAVVPVPTVGAGSIAADYTINPVNGSWSITPLGVTLTAGSYSGVYDGNPHALSACGSSSGLLSCTNSPAGPVGPDVGGPTAVTPTPVYGSAIAGDFTITSNNGSWSITPLAVTLTAGSLSGTYNGSTQSPSACTSSAPTYVTCTNNPASVGPNVGSGPIYVASPYSYAKGNPGDYTITPANGSWSITPVAVTLTGGSYNHVYDGGTHPLSACASSSTLLSCTNSPAGPVGPDVGGPAAVTPTPVYGSAVAGDFTITSNDGSWSITALTVHVTGGGYTGVYDGSAHSPSACSSDWAGVTCTNNPTSVGPNVGSGSVAPASTVVGGIPADYTITPTSGSWSITPLAVTLTGGTYSGVYDGNPHPLTACISSSGLLSCTNSPVGPVGADVGGPTAVAPTPVYGSAVAGDFTITSNSGSWSITPLAVTLTAGSLSGPYTGSAQSPSACTSSLPAFVTCANNPASVGPGVGSGTIYVASPYSYPKGASTDYTVTTHNGTWSIAKVSALATLTVTTDKGLNSSGVPYTQYSDVVNFSINVSPILVTSPLNPGGSCGTGNTYCVSVQIGTQTFGPIALTSNGTALVGNLSNQQVFLAPGSYTVSLLAGDAINGLSQVNSNYTLGTAIQGVNSAHVASLDPGGAFSVIQEDAAVGYNGTTYFAVPSTQTTVNIPVNFTLQDATATGVGSPIYDPWPGDITRTGSVVITLGGQYITSTGTTANYSNTTTCSNVGVVGVTGDTAVSQMGAVFRTATTGPCTFTNVPVNGTYTLNITPGAGSYYAFAGGGDTVVTISTSNGGGGFITGGGYQTASYLNSNPSTKGAKPFSLLGNLVAKMNFGYMAKYNKSGSNLQAQVNVIVRTSCMPSSTITSLGLSNYTPHPGDDGYCLYQIKSNKVISISDTAYVSVCNSTTCGQPGYGVLVVGATITDVTQATPVSLMGGGTLTLQMYDNGEPGISNDTLTLQVTDNKNTLWFSNSWTGTKTAIYNDKLTSTPGIFAPIINGGNLQVH